MKSSTAAPVSNLPASGRRQPARSARTSAPRPSSHYAHSAPYSASTTAAQAQLDPPPSGPPGFFPAITHFTDGLAALPKEVMRHFTLIKETEGKAHQHHQAISEIIDAINRLPSPPRIQSAPHHPPLLGLSLSNSLNGSAANSVIDGSFPGTQNTIPEPPDSAQIVDEQGEMRRRAFSRLCESVKTTLGVLDEKNMVLASANDTLARQIARLDDVMPYVENEVSEEARLGSNTHWALAHMRELRKANGTTTTDRSRREVQSANNLAAAAAAVHEGDIAATRSEARREALLAKRRGNVDSDMDDRPPTKRAPAGSKARKLQDAAEGKSTATGQPAKRRRVDKTGGAAMERSMSGAAANKSAAQRDRDNTAEPVRKRTKALASVAGARKRGPAGSPSMASSPSRGTFATSSNREPLPPANAPRTTNARGRQNSAISNKSGGHDPNARNRPLPTASNKDTAANSGAASAPDSRSSTNPSGRPVVERLSPVKDTWSSADGNTMIEQEGVHGTLVVDPSAAQGSLKREETEPVDEDDASTTNYSSRAEVAASGRSRGGSRATKPSTPIEATDSTVTTAPAQNMARSRSTRGQNNNAALRAGNRNTHSPTSTAAPTASAASPRQRAAASRRTANTYADSARTSPQTSDEEALRTSATTAGNPTGREAYAAANTAELEEEGEEIDPNQDVEAMSSPGSDEPRYCICNGPSYGHMIGCDNPDCPREWFHLACVGMTKLPAARTKWYCYECRELQPRRGGAGSR